MAAISSSCSLGSSRSIRVRVRSSTTCLIILKWSSAKAAVCAHHKVFHSGLDGAGQPLSRFLAHLRHLGSQLAYLRRQPLALFVQLGHTLFAMSDGVQLCRRSLAEGDHVLNSGTVLALQ